MPEDFFFVPGVWSVPLRCHSHKALANSTGVLSLDGQHSRCLLNTSVEQLITKLCMGCFCQAFGVASRQQQGWLHTMSQYWLFCHILPLAQVSLVLSRLSVAKWEMSLPIRWQDPWPQIPSSASHVHVDTYTNQFKEPPWAFQSFLR